MAFTLAFSTFQYGATLVFLLILWRKLIDTRKVCEFNPCLNTRLLTSCYQLAHIPTVGGPSVPLVSYIGSWHFIRDSKGVLKTGYEQVSFKISRISTESYFYYQFKGRLFKVAMLGG
jgi:hypothetical protein